MCFHLLQVYVCVQCCACVCECVPVLYKHLSMGASPTFVYIMFQHIFERLDNGPGGGGGKRGLNLRDNIG